MADLLLNTVKSAVDFLETYKVTEGITLGQVEAQAAEQKAQLEKSIAEADSISPAVGKDILKVIQGTSFASLARLIAGKVSVTTKTSSKKTNEKKQQNLFLQRYMTLDMWKKYRDPDTPYATVLEMMLDLWEKIGLKHPSEHAEVHAVAIMTLRLDGGVQGQVNVNVADAFAKLKDIEDGIKERRKHRLDHAHSGVVKKYAATLVEVKRVHEDIYDFAYGDTEGDQPVNNVPIDEIAIDALRAKLPARKSHGSIALRVGKVKCSGLTVEGVANAVLAAIQHRQPVSGDGVPGLQIFNPKHKLMVDSGLQLALSGPASSGAAPSMPAICDSPASVQVNLSSPESARAEPSPAPAEAVQPKTTADLAATMLEFTSKKSGGTVMKRPAAAAK
ncbi:unnamed protein product, partial [Prorocentrum cordatum]